MRAKNLLNDTSEIESQGLETTSKISDYDFAIMEGGHSLEEPVEKSALREAVKLDELVGWKQSQPQTKKKVKPVPNTALYKKDTRSELQRIKDQGKKNWFAIEGVAEASNKSGYKEIEFLCANPEFPDATDPELQKQMYLGLKQIPGVVPLFQDQSDYSEGQYSLTAIYKDRAVRGEILKLAKQLGVQVDLEQPVSDNYVDRAIRGEHEGQQGVAEDMSFKPNKTSALRAAVSPKKLVVFDIDDTLVYTQTKVHVIKDGHIITSLNSHDFTHYKLKPGESFDFGDFRNAREFFNNSKPNIPMMNQLKRDINTGNKVVMVTARADFDDKELFLDTFRKFGVDIDKVHVYRAGNSNQGTTEERKKRIIKNLLNQSNYDKAIMYDDAKPNLHTFMELKKEHPETTFYAWHVSLDGNANEYMREQVEEAEVDTVYAQDLDREFRRMGYKKLGSGTDAKVWAADENYIIKILMPEEETSRAGEVFRKFYEFCEQHPNIKCLPKINEHNTIDVLGKEYIQIDMERLIPLKRNSFEEGVVWFLSDYVSNGRPWETVNSDLSGKHWEFYNKRMASSLAEQWKNLSRQELADLKELYSVMSMLYKTGQINKFGWDLHTENVMKRKDGTLVIIDPWFSLTSDLTEDVELDEDWKSTLGNLAIAGSLAAAGTGSMVAKQAASDYFTKPTSALSQAVQPSKQQPKIDTKVLQAKQKEQPKVTTPAPQVKKKEEVKPITNNPLETLLLSVAKASGLQGTELAAFMAQCAHETLDFKRMVEFGGKLDFRKYDPKHAPKKAKILGNKKAGDGERYKGRGYIQLTGRYNYKKAGEELGLPLEQKPHLVEDPEVAAKVAVWFWKHRVQPNVDNFHDVVDVTKYINPAMRGLKDRTENFKAYISATDIKGNAV